jgi:protein-S-isoprenylcysteine O-methyltransferase
MYHVANGLALAEYLLGLYFRPSLKSFPYVSLLGVVVVLFGQFLRSAAMIKASSNFSHMVAFRKLTGHQLVTDGVYKWSRHPSYAGFFYWALGTQLVLQNPFSFFVFWALLMRFFSSRIKGKSFLTSRLLEFTESPHSRGASVGHLFRQRLRLVSKPRGH